MTKKINITDKDIMELESIGNDVRKNEASSQELSKDEEELILKEYENNKKYGDRPIAAAAAGAARGVSFGLSDQALVKSGLVDESTLREIEERNQAASLIGEGAGIIVPSLLTGGTAGAVGIGVKGAARAAAATELFTAKALSKIIAETGKKKFAQEVLRKSIPKAAGSAVEGAFYGAGHLISEEALGRAEINAENIVSEVGTGALFGAATGGIFGAAEALVPIVKNNKIVDYAVKKLKPKDVNNSVWELAGRNPTAISKLKERSPAVFDNAEDYVVRKELVKTIQTSDDFFNRVSADLKSTGDDIGKTLKAVDDQLVINPSLAPTKHQVGISIVNKLEDLKSSFKSLPFEDSKIAIKKIDKEIKNFTKDFVESKEVFTGSELNTLKQDAQGKANWAKRGNLPLSEQVARKTSRAIREEVTKLADNVSSIDIDLGKQLRQQNLDYGTAIEILDTLESKAIKDSSKSVLDLRDAVIAASSFGADATGIGATVIAARKFAKSDFRRRLAITSGIEKRIQTVDKKLTSIVKNFEDININRPTTPIVVSTLMDSGISRPLDKPNQKPATKLEAINNIRNNIEQLKSNPEILEKKAMIATQRLQDSAPNIAANTGVVLNKAVEFLDSKLPRQNTAPGALQMMQKKFTPSSSEVAKFERYMHAVEKPLEALSQLEENKLSRETVETLKFVYPEIYSKMQGMTMDNISKDPSKYSYKKRLQLGILLDVPADTSLIPSNIMNLQKSFSDAEQAREEEVSSNRAAVNTTVGGINKIGSAERAQSDTERVKNRK